MLVAGRTLEPPIVRQEGALCAPLMTILHARETMRKQGSYGDKRGADRGSPGLSLPLLKHLQSAEEARIRPWSCGAGWAKTGQLFRFVVLHGSAQF